MAEQPKKFTFGFSKVTKKSNLAIPAPSPKLKKSAVQYIDCLEEKSIKLRDGQEEENVPIVIPINGPRKSSTVVGKSIAEIAEDFSSISDGTSNPQPEPAAVLQSNQSESLDAIAAREILQEVSDTKKDDGTNKLDALPLLDTKDKEELQKESTLEDYENIPVTQFGLAMLRGMGWKEDGGIGKNQKVVAVAAPQVRPKGMGLGADKVSLGNVPTTSKKGEGEEELKLIKGAFVKVLGGSYRNQYAQVEGFNDDSGRVILKMAIGGLIATVNEAAVQLVSKSEYQKNSKVLNATKYDEFKKKEESNEGKSTVSKKSELATVKDDPISESRIHKQGDSPKRKRSLSPVTKFKKERSSSDDRKDHTASSRGGRNYLSRSRSPAKGRQRRSRSSSRSFTPDNRQPMKSSPQRSPNRLRRKSSPQKSNRRSSHVRDDSPVRKQSPSPVRKKKKERSSSDDRKCHTAFSHGGRKNLSPSRSPVGRRQRRSRSSSRSLTPDSKRPAKSSPQRSPKRSRREISPEKSKRGSQSHSKKRKKTHRKRSTSSSSRNSHSPSKKRNKKKKKRKYRDSSTESSDSRSSRSVTHKKKSKESKRRSRSRSRSSKRRQR